MKKSIFLQNLEKNKTKLNLYNDGIKKGLIQPFDQEVLTNLRNLYYGCISGIIYIYGMATDCGTIANKMILLRYALDDRNFQIVHGNTYSTENIFFDKYNNNLDNNSWIEVKEGNKEWVYDPFSLLKIEKNLYYQIEEPEVFRIISKKDVESHPGRIDDDYYRFDEGGKEFLTFILPSIEKNLKNNPHKDFLKAEISRFKEEVDNNSETPKVDDDFEIKKMKRKARLEADPYWEIVYNLRKLKNSKQ